MGRTLEGAVECIVTQALIKMLPCPSWWRQGIWPELEPCEKKEIISGAIFPTLLKFVYSIIRSRGPGGSKAAAASKRWKYIEHEQRMLNIYQSTPGTGTHAYMPLADICAHSQ